MKQMWTLALVLAIGVAAVGQVEPLGIVVEPPAGDLMVTITTDKPVYAVGETVKITFTLNKAAYIIIVDQQPDGNSYQIFPNQYESQNYFPAGTHTIPTPGKGYQFTVNPPLGTEWLWIIASTQPISSLAGFSPGEPFPLLGADPENVQVQVLGLVPEPTQRAFDFTNFEIVSGPAPGYGTLIVRTSPATAKLYVDGIFRGYTPRTLNLVPGFHDILIRKTGYGDYTARVYLVAGGTRTLDVVLAPTGPANQPPVAQFTFTPPVPTPGAPVSFSAASSYDPDGTIVTYQWDFNGDGVFDRTGVTATWTFPVAGTYQVRLVVTDGLGATGQRTQPVTVAAMNQPPVARFAYTPTAPRPGDWIQFDGGASFDPDGEIAAYQWDFQNDGIFDRTGTVTFWQYATPGTYTVRLVVTDNQGATGQTTQTVVVTPLVMNRPPVAQFTYSPVSPTVGTTVTFNGTTSYDPDGTIVAYAWDLNGDGAVDRAGPIVSWTYAVAGAYNATLYVTDNEGATGQMTQPVMIAVAGPPGMPAMAVPGIYVWGTDTWRITVNGASTWSTPRGYRIELRTDGEFINVSTDTGPVPLGLVPEPVSEGWRIVFDGTVTSGRITYSFQVRNATSIYLDLQLDMDGDGDLDRSPGFVRLRQLGINPPLNPLVVGSPEGYSGALVPSLNFRIGSALSYTEFVRIVFWQTTIGALEGI
ncbi:MAG TPA: PKD domain-containing protein [Candidatus Bipolaricaulis sp.]|nr:PKD domain-containing protein [Candidatus Bipolaricaulis sp.]